MHVRSPSTLGLSKAKTSELGRAALLPADVVQGLASAATSQSVEQVSAAVRRARLDHAHDIPTTRVGRPHVLVVVDLPTLQAEAGGSAALASRAVISGDEARQLAQEANVCRIVTAGRSQVLDVGRTTRAVPHHLAKAVIARDRHCTHRGCHAPPWACENHHITHWAAGWSTSLANLELRCWHHHHDHHRNQPRPMPP